MNQTKTNSPEIKPISSVSSYKQHSINGLSVEQIWQKIGFGPNHSDDPCKVKFSWCFSVDGVECAVWDWKGSARFNQFSAYGPTEALQMVFGNALNAAI